MGSKEDAERLEKATQAAREVLSEVRGVTKDLNAAVKEARTLFGKMVEDEVRKEIMPAVAKLQEVTEQAMRDSVAKVMSEFDRLSDLLMGRTSKERKRGETDIPTLVQRLAEQDEQRVVLTFNDAREAARFVQEVRDLYQICYQDGTTTFSDVYVEEYCDDTQWHPPHGAITRKPPRLESS